MNLAELAIFYAVLGGAVAVAVALADRSAGPRQLFFRAGTSFLFWPLYLPALLSVKREVSPSLPAPQAPEDAMGVAIARVEAELAAALSSLDGWAEDVLAREDGKIAELELSLRAQAERIRQLDALLAREKENGGDLPGAAGASPGSGDRVQKCEEARRQNLERLRTVRARAHQDLLGTLAWVRELVSMIHLAKFTGAPAARAEELVAQIAAAVEGLSAVQVWEDEGSVRKA